METADPLQERHCLQSTAMTGEESVTHLEGGEAGDFCLETADLLHQLFQARLLLHQCLLLLGLLLLKLSVKMDKHTSASNI